MAGRKSSRIGRIWLGTNNVGKVFDKLKDDLELLIDQTDLIHDELFMMGMMDPWVNELKPF
jgi:hypothetical protein